METPQLKLIGALIVVFIFVGALLYFNTSPAVQSVQQTTRSASPVPDEMDMGSPSTSTASAIAPAPSAQSVGVPSKYDGVTSQVPPIPPQPPVGPAGPAAKKTSP